MEINDENVKIKIYLKDKGNLLANVNVTIDTVEYGYLTVKGFQIWRSQKFNSRLQENINITPPRRKIYGAYIDLAFFDDVNKWYKLEARIYDAYHIAQTKKENKKVENEDIDPNDINL